MAKLDLRETACILAGMMPPDSETIAAYPHEMQGSSQFRTSPTACH